VTNEISSTVTACLFSLESLVVLSKIPLRFSYS
jgi:hypothetical protein